MKQFFKFLFASFFGTFIAIFFCFAVLFAIIGIFASSAGSNDQLTVADNSVLYIDFEEEISDRSSNNPLENFDFGNFEAQPQLGLNEILKNLKKASEDSRIKGLFMDLTVVDLGMARMNEIRNAIKQFRDSGKFVYTYGEFLSQNAYYLASVSDKIYLHPGGIMEFNGLSSNRMFFKGTLDKLEIDMEIIRHGKYKSAVEPFSREGMSDENREQTEAFMGSLWNNMVREIANARKLKPEDLNMMADNIAIGSPEDAVKYGLVDGVEYKDAVFKEMKGLTSTDEDAKINFIKIKKYTHAALPDDVRKNIEDYKNKVAVVYASGEIRSGENENEIMGSETISEAIEKARLDENIKAVVLRVNSPGGSSLASDVIWREVMLTKEVKPVVVSMGNLAASGGYYIACGANKIIADENTITGSIGVFGVIPNARNFFKNKLGITFDTVNTNVYSDIFSGVRSLKPIEIQYITKMIERIYDDFVTKVAEGRKMTYAAVDSIGQGRVWSGADALKIGLIDEIGGMDHAIEVAAALAEVKNYRILELPEQKDPFKELLNEFTENMESKITQEYFGNYYNDLNHVYRGLTERGIYMRLPFDFKLE